MSRYPVPPDDRLEQLIRASFDFMPGPDMVRLELIEAKLYRHREPEKQGSSMNKLPWWIVLIFAGGFAAAAWWSGGPWFKRAYQGAVKEQVEAAQQVPGGRDAGPGIDVPAPDLQDEGEQRQDSGESPVIYQRED